jgi:hypothetical protein
MTGVLWGPEHVARGAVAAILVVEALEPSGCGRDRLARFADELGGAFVEADLRSASWLRSMFVAKSS